MRWGKLAERGGIAVLALATLALALWAAGERQRSYETYAARDQRWMKAYEDVAWAQCATVRDFDAAVSLAEGEMAGAEGREQMAGLILGRQPLPASLATVDFQDTLDNLKALHTGPRSLRDRLNGLVTVQTKHKVTIANCVKGDFATG